MDSSQQDCSIKKLHLQSREECVPYQIFPDSSEDSEMSQMHQRRRLPSIVVDPTQAEEDRGQLPWPPHRRTSGQEQEDDALSQANILSQGENVDADREQRGAHTKHSTANASPGLIDHTLLTPPPSPEPSEVAPPCFRG